jgi:hypothetical protein
MISKNSVPTNPSKVRNISGNNTATRPKDFENRYVNVKQTRVEKTNPKLAFVLKRSKNP